MIHQLDVHGSDTQTSAPSRCSSGVSYRSCAPLHVHTDTNQRSSLSLSSFPSFRSAFASSSCIKSSLVVTRPSQQCKGAEEELCFSGYASLLRFPVTLITLTTHNGMPLTALPRPQIH